MKAQDFSQSYLNGLEDEELLTLFDEMESDTLKQEKIARVYLERGRREGDTIKMARAYERLALIFHKERNISFSDSVIELTKNINNITYPAQGYLIRGYNKDHNEYEPYLAFNDYLKAYEIAKDRGNIPQQTYLMDRLIFLQGEWGDMQKALELQKKRHALMKKNHLEDITKSTRESKRENVKNFQVKDEIISYECFVFCYLGMQKMDSARIYIQKVFEKMETYEAHDKLRDVAWGLDALMEVEYHTGNYEKVIELGDSISSIESPELSLYYIKNPNLFQGLAYLEMGQSDKALAHLSVADSILRIEGVNSLIQSDRLLYKGLFEAYKEKGDAGKQIEYLDKIIGLDSVIKKNYLEFEPKHIREFETPLLLEEKQQLINSLEKKDKRNNKILIGGASLFVVTLVFLGYYYRRQRLFKKRFEALVQAGKVQTTPIPVTQDIGALDISEEVVSQIMKQLSVFEEKQQYINPKLSLNELAKIFNTNSSYLSRIVNYKKGKGFSDYINDLRLEYCINDLLTQEMYRKFTIKAIAEECGYKSGESFSRIFFKKYGIYPSYYIKEIEKKRREA